jgi:hypothetical protein
LKLLNLPMLQETAALMSRIDVPIFVFIWSGIASLPDFVNRSQGYFTLRSVFGGLDWHARVVSLGLDWSSKIVSKCAFDTLHRVFYTFIAFTL